MGWQTIVVPSSSLRLLANSSPAQPFRQSGSLRRGGAALEELESHLLLVALGDVRASALGVLSGAKIARSQKPRKRNSGLWLAKT
ncbi:MAG: hypothetical protein ACLPUT_01775 [Solirubrobacteraceae bacterium]